MFCDSPSDDHYVTISKNEGMRYSLYFDKHLDIAGLLLDGRSLTARSPIHRSWRVAGPLSDLSCQMIHCFKGWKKRKNNSHLKSSAAVDITGGPFSPLCPLAGNCNNSNHDPDSGSYVRYAEGEQLASRIKMCSTMHRLEISFLCFWHKIIFSFHRKCPIPDLSIVPLSAHFHCVHCEPHLD